MNAPTAYSPESAQLIIRHTGTQQYDKRWNCWRTARPSGWYGLVLRHRLRLAWRVFTGRADVLDWDLPPGHSSASS